MKQLLKRPMLPEILGYITVVLVVFQQAIIPPSGWMIFGDDIHRAYYFFREFFTIWLRRGVIPWWNPYLFGGMPFIADPMVIIWYPINWIFFIIPLHLAYSWHIIFHLLWAGIGMCVLARNATGNRVAAWAAGLVFMLSGFFMARTWSGHVDVIAAASWMPWVIHMFVRVLARDAGKKQMVLAGVVFALQLLSGYQTMAFMTVIFVGILIVVWLVREQTIRPIFRAILAGIIGLGFSAFHLLPVAEFFRASIRTFRLPYSWVSYGSWTPASLIQMLSPFFFGDQNTYNGPPPNFGEHSAFIGVIGLLFVMVGMYVVSRAYKASKSRMSSTFFLGISAVFATVFGTWMSLGSSIPMDIQYIAWKIIPMYQYLRIPTRHLTLVVFGLSLLSGIGMSYVFDTLRAFRWVRWVIVAALVVEMGTFGRHFIELYPIPEARHERALIHTLTQDKAPYRVLQNFGVWVDARDALDFDSVMPYGIFSATGYSPSILRSYYEYIASATGVTGERAMLAHDVQIPYLSPANAEALDFLNIKYILVPPDHDPFTGNPRYRLIWDDDARKYRLYENTTVYPRFFLSDRSCGSARVDEFTPNRVILSVETTCDTTLISSEVWYPGWYATIDGKKASLDSSNRTFRTLFVSGGNHTITYEYFPGIYLFGWGITLLTVAVVYIAAKRR